MSTSPESNSLLNLIATLASPTNAADAPDALRRTGSAIEPAGRPELAVPSDKVSGSGGTEPGISEIYQVLVEQIPAILFMAYLDRTSSEAYVSPQIEEKLGFTQQEWLDDPIRWYHQIHPEDRDRWSVEAADTVLRGKPLSSVFRVMAKDGRVIWFGCETRIIRHPDGRPWFIHGIAFDVTDQKEAEESLRRLSSQLLILQDEERRRIARDLHDSTAQTVCGVAIILDALRSRLSGVDQETVALLEEGIRLAEQARSEIRDLSHLLHPPNLDQVGLKGAIQWYVDRFSLRTQIKVTVDLAAEVRRYPREIETAVFRVMQEALANIQRHSGSSTARIELKTERHWLRMLIADQGRGLAPKLKEKIGAGSGIGLAGMRERIVHLGGSIDIQSGPNQGTTVTISIPIP